MKIISYCFAIVFILVVSSCTSTTPYPKSWPEVSEAPSVSCSYLEGTYQNFNGKKYLSDLFGMDYELKFEVQEIKLDVSNQDRLKLIGIEDEKEFILYEITAEADDYECVDGTIHFKGLREYYFHAFVNATSRAEIKINVAEDQSLIAEVKHESFTLGFFVMPIFSNKIDWGRWEKLD